MNSWVGVRVRRALLCIFVMGQISLVGTALKAQVERAPEDAAPATLPVVERNADGHATVRAFRLDEPLYLDGRLDEGIYERIPAISDFIQQVPTDGELATEKTEVWILYDDVSIYVSARCWDSAPPSEWVADEYRRDQIRQNDTFGVAFDTFLDRRNGFIFYTNPVGARADYVVTEESANFDWNPVWDVKIGQFEGGWTVELEVPFKTLRYGPGEDQVWGIQLRRVVRHKNEWAYLNRVPPSASGPFGFTRISFGGTLLGLKAPVKSKNFEVKPYAIARMTTDRQTDPPVSNDGDADFGVDVKYGVTANLTADFTYNPDFAQVEVDERQVNLTRFSLQFPEKREFFLEGRGLFDFGRGPGGGGGGATAVQPVLFYSRRIGIERSGAVPLDFGARLTGKTGRFGIGAMNIQASEDAAGVVPSTNFTALRLKSDVLRRSFVGAMFTNRSNSVVAGTGSNQAYGVDALFSFYQNLFFSGNYARSQTPELNGRDTTYEGKFSYTGDRYGAELSHLMVGGEFNPEVGFVRRGDFRRTYGLARFSPRPSSLESIRQFTWEGSIEYLENLAGFLETRVQRGFFSTEFENSDLLSVEATNNYERLVSPFPIAPDVTIPAGEYSFANATLSYQMGTQRRVSGTMSGQFGDFYDGTIRALTYQGRITVLDNFSLEPTVSVNWVDLPHGDFTETLVRTRADYAFTPRMFLGGLIQYSSGDSTFSSNVRFRWEYQPGSELFIVYTDARDTTFSGFPVLENRAFVVKVNRLWRF